MWGITVFSAAFLLVGITAAATTALQSGEVAYKVTRVNADKYDFTVTDGQYVIIASTSKSVADMVECSLYYSPVKAAKLLVDTKVNVENIGLSKIKMMRSKCRRYQTSNRRATSDDDHDTFNHDLVKGQPFPGDFSTGSPSGAGSHFAIFPGTKWCGFQNVAVNMQDLGIHNKTDACCRTHDHCPYYMDRFETKYHYFNKYPWTLSHCDCDQHLFDCLKRVNMPASNDVGKLFFGLLDVQCFAFKTGTYCSNESSILSQLWCDKTQGSMAVVRDFPHKWADTQPTVEADNNVIG